MSRCSGLDAKIAEQVHRHFTAQGVPVLSVHDSFIIDYTRVMELKRVMQEAAAAVVGQAMAVSASGPGLDEMDPAVRLDFETWTQNSRSPGYLRRMKAWEARVGREVTPSR